MDIQAFLDGGIGYITHYGLSVIGAIALLIVGRIAAAWGRSISRKALDKAKVDPTLVAFFAKTVYYLILIVVVIAVLSLFGVETTSLIAVLGAAGLAVGLALQGTLSNFAAGVMLLIFRPFKLDDFVDIGGTMGSVMEIGLFSTTLKTSDNVKIVVPNSSVWGGTISNYNGYDTRRLDLVIGISYDDNIQTAMDTIRSIVTADERVLTDPALQIAVSNLGDSSVDLIVRPWCRGADYWDLRFDLTRKIKEGLEAAGCSIPYPQQDVHMHQAS
ncbi:MAG: mechanosensitive ion channel [Thermoanaerobaculales bacterium]|nr:mechanosensitive ion channel [Thermoanaerobaculales bacterium]